jgi:hypothetical protein
VYPRIVESSDEVFRSGLFRTGIEPARLVACQIHWTVDERQPGSRRKSQSNLNEVFAETSCLAAHD